MLGAIATPPRIRLGPRSRTPVSLRCDVARRLVEWARSRIIFLELSERVSVESETLPLIDRARAGDPSAWAALIQRENRRLIGVLAGCLKPMENRAELVEDLLQDVHLEAFQQLDRFEDRGPGSFSRWVAGISRNKALHVLRAGRRRETPARLDQTGAPTVRSLRTTPSSGAIKQELKSRLFQAIDTLPDDYRQVILLRHFEGLDGKATAEALDRSEGAVRVLFFRAMTRLGEALQGLGEVAS